MLLDADSFDDSANALNFRVEALQYAKKAVNLSQSESKELKNYTTRFLQDMEKDYKRHR